MKRKWKIAGIDFSHMHMGDNLRMAFGHPDVEVVGVCDANPEKMRDAIGLFSIPEEKVFTDYQECLEKTKPDLVITCPATARHGEMVAKIAPYGVHILMEKPFAASLAEADAMVAAMPKDKLLAINWPLAWYPAHRTAKRLIDEGAIGDVIEVHFYDGNRGPLYHLADKAETTPEWITQEKPKSWFYQKGEGGGSLLDYLGYGTTLGTWFQDGRAPIEVCCMVDEPSGLEVDEHSITIARYAHGLSKFETRWGTFTDPWTHQPQPKCGFNIVGTGGTLSNYDYEVTIRIQSRDCPEGKNIPVDNVETPFQNPVQYMLHCMESGAKIEGPLSPAISRIGQQIVDTALQSAREKRTLKLLD